VPAPPEPVSIAVEFGPFDLVRADPEAAPTFRMPLDPSRLAWITGIAVEAPDGVEVSDAGVTLDVEADVIRLSRDAASFRLPPGFGVPVSRARGELPPDWRGLHATARAAARDTAVDRARFVVTVEGFGPDAAGLTGVWRIPVEADAASTVVLAADGTASVRTALAAVLPAAGTIHAIVPRTVGRAREVRIASRSRGEVVATLARDANGSLAAWIDGAGVAVGPAADLDLEFEVPPGAPFAGAAVDVYLRPADDAPLRYPGPDDADRAAR